MNAPPQPFFDLADCIEAAEKAAISARSLALDNPEQAERHEARAVGYDRDAKRWRDELAISDEEDARITAEEAAKSETDVQREALQLLSKALLRFKFEVSAEIEELKARVAALEGKMK